MKNQHMAEDNIFIFHILNTGDKYFGVKARLGADLPGSKLSRSISLAQEIPSKKMQKGILLTGQGRLKMAFRIIRNIKC